MYYFVGVLILARVVSCKDTSLPASRPRSDVSCCFITCVGFQFLFVLIKFFHEL